MKRLKKKVLQTLLPAEPRAKYYNPKTGIMTLRPPGPPVTFGEALAYGLNAMGGNEGFADWAAHNPGHAFTLMARTLPMELAGKGGGPVEVTFVDPLKPTEPKQINPAPLPKPSK